MKMHLAVWPKPHGSVFVKIQMPTRTGQRGTIGHMHMPVSVFPAFRLALASQFELTVSGSVRSEHFNAS